MAIAKMKKLYLIAHQDEKNQVLGTLQHLGVMEVSDLQTKDADRETWADLVESDQETDALQEFEARIGEVRFSLDFLKRHYPAKKSMADAFGGTKETFSAEKFSANAADWDKITAVVYAELRKADEKLLSLRNEETRLYNLKTQLTDWDKLDAPLEEIKATAAVRIEIGTLPEAGLDPCRNQLASVVPESYLYEVNTFRGETFIFLAFPADHGDEVQSLLKQHNFNRQSFPALEGTPADNLARIETDLAALKQQRQATLADAQKQAEYREILNYFHDYLVMERDRKQVVGNFARTNHSFVAEGWIRAADVSELKKRLSSCATAEMVSREPREGENYPVCLENTAFARPFEFITKLYGTPSPRGLDPTFALAPFFIVFFGLCMTDAGYGVVLALLGALGLWKLKLGESARKLFWILMAGGLSTIVFGSLVGGWLGGLIPIKPLFFDALADPMRMLVYALGIGIFQIFVGMGIKFYRNVRAGEILDGIYDQGLWFALIIGLLLLAAAPELAGIGKIMALSAAVGLVLTQGRTQPTIIKKLLSGLLSLYNITGYLSDVLSYSRLLALGLATGVIALAINTMAGLVGGSVIGYIIMVIVLIGGHSFNLIINTLGSYIHSSRLQYIEFFNRFYEGGGRAFVPFRLNTRHVNILADWKESGNHSK